MRTIFYAMTICSLLAGCSSSRSEPESESAQTTQQALDVTLTSGLTAMQGTILGEPIEANRQADTEQYYQTVQIGPSGQSGGTVRAMLPKLKNFTDFYFNDPAHETVAKYYNRGDLGIGREMHCVDRGATQEIACYVKNYFAGDAGGEFSFGLSSNIAFANMDTDTHFATVCMVWRRLASTSVPFTDKVYFAVYNATDDLSDAAALDRVGVQFATAFPLGGANPVGHGTPGQNFNNHIPSNCIVCHGGKPYNYDKNDNANPTDVLHPKRSQFGALFLPFDLDQFDFDATHPRDEAALRGLNRMVWTVANQMPNEDLNASVRNQISLWYNNTSLNGNLTGNFTQAVPSGWSSPAGQAVYLNVVRGSCRNCHMTNHISSLHFDTEAQFKTILAGSVSDIKKFRMPHSVQSLRLFWQSNQPAQLAAYLRDRNGGNNPALAIQLEAAGPGDVATLDPPLIGVNSSGF